MSISTYKKALNLSISGLQHYYVNTIYFPLRDIIILKPVKLRPFIKAQQFLILNIPNNFSLLYFLKNFLTFSGFEPQFLIKLFLIKKTKCTFVSRMKIITYVKPFR